MISFLATALMARLVPLNCFNDDSLPHQPFSDPASEKTQSWFKKLVISISNTKISTNFGDSIYEQALVLSLQ